jgi:hypothetical protein
MTWFGLLYRYGFSRYAMKMQQSASILVCNGGGMGEEMGGMIKRVD